MRTTETEITHRNKTVGGVCVCVGEEGKRQGQRDRKSEMKNWKRKRRSEREREGMSEFRSA